MTAKSTKPDQPDAGEPDAGEAPRTDLPPTREPYYEGYFGDADQEEQVRGEREIREENIPDDEAEKKTPKGEDL
jgi:hypothetical protein